MRERQERKLAQLRAIRADGAATAAGPALTLELGIGSTQCVHRLVHGGRAPAPNTNEE